MSFSNSIDSIQQTDIYIIDQILKGRYKPADTILDAGCGSSRNLKWFYDNGINFYAVDADSESLKTAKSLYPLKKDNITLSQVENLPFTSEQFDHIICSAVLHFAKDTPHFELMFAELVRVLKPNGSLFIRVAAAIGIEQLIEPISEGIYKLPDQTERFLVTRALIDSMVSKHNLAFLEPIKTTNVSDIRCMTTLVLQK